MKQINNLNLIIKKILDRVRALFKKVRASRFFNVARSIFKGIWLVLRSSATAVFYSIITFFVILSVFLFLVYQGYAKDFKNEKIRSNSTQNLIYDKDGALIYESYGARNPDAVKLNEVPELIKNATLAAEDVNFYKHGAIDPRGIARAAYLNVSASEKVGASKLYDLFSERNYTQGGGSSITQQLVKNLYLTSEKSFDRKIREIIYSFEMENKWDKDKIFEEYLNNVYYGEQSLGIKNAAKRYFNKNLDELTLAEVSLLAGLPVSPTKLSPISGDYNASKERQAYVLSNMFNHDMITEGEARAAIEEPLVFNDKEEELLLKHPFYVDVVQKEAKFIMGEEKYEKGGFIINTFMDEPKQNLIEKTASDYVKKFKYRRVSNSAVVVLDNKEGTIPAIIGGTDWEKSKVNIALSKRQPGSSFKPIVYTTGLLNGFTAASRLADVYVNFGGTPAYAPRNYDGGYRGNVSMRIALANSLNIPAVEMAKLVGIEKVIDTAEKFGIRSIDKEPNNYGLSLALGSAEVTPLELAEAYTVFANNGKRSSFSTISTIKDSEGNIIYQHPKLQEEVLDEKVAFIMSDILSDNQARSMVFGTNSPLYIKGRRVAAKTGTTDDFADSWTMGFTPQYTVGVWMGNNDRTKMARVSGYEGAAYVWKDVITELHKGLPAEDFKKPDGLSEVWVNPYTQARTAVERRPNYKEYFLPGTEPSQKPDFSYLNQFYRYYRSNKK